jgi:cob(I)alamin adenosyltransferase
MIYTKKGDKGTTTLVGGRSVSKADMQVEVYGTIDELNSHIGLAVAFLRAGGTAGAADGANVVTAGAGNGCGVVATADIAAFLEKLQKELFLLGNLYASDMSAGSAGIGGASVNGGRNAGVADGASAGSERRSAVTAGKQFSLPFITEKNVNELEREINNIEATLPSLKEFILPNGNVAASQLHVCRTVCRRLERLIVLFEIKHTENRENIENGTENAFLAQKYINRLSDYLFVAARLASI